MSQNDTPPPPPPPPPPPARGPWVAYVVRAGLFGWNVRVTNGLIQYGPDGGEFLWFGSRDRVTRKARRLLDRLNSPDPVERFTVR